MPRSLLVITRHTPLPWEDGAGAYLFDVMSACRNAGFTVHLAWLAPHQPLRWRGIWTLPKEFSSVVRLHVPGGRRFGRHIVFPIVCGHLIKKKISGLAARLLSPFILRRKGRPPGSPPPDRGWMSPPSPKENAFTQELVHRLRPGALIVNYAWLTPLFPADRSIQRVCIHSDVAWQRSQLLASMQSQKPEIDRATEADWLRQTDVLVAITENDAREFRLMTPDTRIIVAPKACTARDLPLTEGSRLLFVGSDNQFNAEGLDWFLREVWPFIRASAPSVTFDVCGSVCRLIPNAPEGVHLHGRVNDLQPLYAASTVVIVPLLRATGLNIKLIDAAANSRPVVTTPATLIGAPWLTGSVLTAGDAPEFAHTVLRVLGDRELQRTLAASGLRAVRENLSPEKCYTPLLAALRT